MVNDASSNDQAPTQHNLCGWEHPSSHRTITIPADPRRHIGTRMAINGLPAPFVLCLTAAGLPCFPRQPGRASRSWGTYRPEWSGLTAMETSMNTNKPEKPLYRVTFSRITGKDVNGPDILARPKEIGAAWSRKGDKKIAILTLDLIPTDLVNRDGVLFLVPVEESWTPAD